MSFTNFNDIAKSKNQVIRIIHVPTSTKVEFAAFLTEFSDEYSVGWGDEKIFGRNDSVKPYQSTTRTISLGFDILSPSFESARENMSKISTLTKMLYPVYSEPLDGSGGSVGRSIKAPPLIRLGFVNLIQSAGGGGDLLGCIEGFSFSPNKDAGYFVEASGELFSKHYNVSFRFTPQHENPLGWDTVSNSFLTDTFPYSSISEDQGQTNQNNQNASLDQASEDRSLE
tara:strand:+ start:8736 stop:9416 length:681 start_codon:yes stop_codon:yes gene_type:complete